MALVRERTIPTERPPPVGEVSANFCATVLKYPCLPEDFLEDMEIVFITYTLSRSGRPWQSVSDQTRSKKSNITAYTETQNKYENYTYTIRVLV
jgi:hypothetical protein